MYVLVSKASSGEKATLGHYSDCNSYCTKQQRYCPERSDNIRDDGKEVQESESHIKNNACLSGRGVISVVRWMLSILHY